MKTYSKVNTKFDGVQTVEFWTKEEFHDRDIKIYSRDEVQVIKVPDETIICDFCNSTIEDFPVPIIFNNALCKKCYEEVLL
jgi:hypothetical protein